jgi:hypothetical protein
MSVTILLAAQTSSQMVEHFSKARLKDLLLHARDILTNYKSHTTLASRCSSVLKLIEDNIDMVDPETERGLTQGMQDQPANNNTISDNELVEMSAPRKNSVHLAWVDNYAFDWNDWPMFFAQLDDIPESELI